MKRDDSMPDGTAGGVTSPEVFQQLGEMTRQLHDTLTQLGFMPRLGEITDSLPDARSRLNYIANKTAEAAEKVLNLVDQAKAEQGQIATRTRHIAQAIVADPVKAVASGDVMNFVGDVDAATARIDQYLTDIMLAQDFHDLTGQVVAKVVKLATDIEDQLVALLLKAAPPGQAHKVEQTFLNGPVVNPEGRTDVVTSQEQVDDLLASLGF
ncbi:protein phosphatase CheZ [Caldimonas thermodepolymerans]|jgi:Chemotaxis protein|uniref:Protein phosphatase CheZ n=1 Tax=Caldimonas thermodepolymerans TaxID=215580 RepID=A0A2S5T0P7_9BURK|nr:protein phosphatase CheZ [Caldimonas thermodepolymerans]PPE68458.1 chemotaxis protein CheZ [Caldimonas thermodepolymerans]QPC30774.1 protein phosphatase CheZ [Caldimonas thermodepolymerans]RDI02606.1 chemotaxis protein CheZ [Caldimonas thermodepolymerans]TCP08866.1 chemotaxis protein CheZ [Caldimonas thermodepolymerans]UZG47185.1 protein phosphatase CheZ [Caldimonas thermodepolymerans]